MHWNLISLWSEGQFHLLNKNFGNLNPKFDQCFFLRYFSNRKTMIEPFVYANEQILSSRKFSKHMLLWNSSFDSVLLEHDYSKAVNYLQGLTVTSDNYDEAVDSLASHFGDSQDVIQVNIDVFSALNSVSNHLHLVSRFACNTRVIVDASSNPPVSHVKIAVTKT